MYIRLKYFFTQEGNDTLNFVELEMQQIIDKLNSFGNPKIWDAAIFASLIGIPDSTIRLFETDRFTELLISYIK